MKRKLLIVFLVAAAVSIPIYFTILDLVDRQQSKSRDDVLKIEFAQPVGNIDERISGSHLSGPATVYSVFNEPYLITVFVISFALIATAIILLVRRKIIKKATSWWFGN